MSRLDALSSGVTFLAPFLGMALLSVLVCSLPEAQGEPIYSIENPGSLESGAARSMNNSGQGRLVDLGTPGGNWSAAYAMEASIGVTGTNWTVEQAYATYNASGVPGVGTFDGRSYAIDLLAPKAASETEALSSQPVATSEAAGLWLTGSGLILVGGLGRRYLRPKTQPYLSIGDSSDDAGISAEGCECECNCEWGDNGADWQGSAGISRHQDRR